jgi:Spy/CpxP family protein refolding chaperone
MTRRIPLALAAILVAALALPMTATAAPGRARCNDLRALARALALTRDQISETKEIYKDLRSTVEPLREQLETLLDGDNPAPGQVGQVVIDIDGLRDDIQSARAEADSAFEAILTPEQLQKYHEFEAHCRPGADA